MVLVEKINRARRVKFSPHETATQKVFFPTFFSDTLYNEDICVPICQQVTAPKLLNRFH
jgi:hypothetical protein